MRDTAGGAEEVVVNFRDRKDAGRRLAEALRRADCDGHDVVVLALPRGGVPVAFEVASALRAPLDVIVVRKLGVPFQPELAMGAIGEEGVRVANKDVLHMTGLDAIDLQVAEGRERVELGRRARRYREGRRRIDVAGRCAIIVDDGIATGSSARAACQVARALGAARIVLAAPVASRLAAEELRGACDQLVCLEVPEPFFAVGEWYRDFSQTSDDEVIALLRRAAVASAHPPARSPADRDVPPPGIDVEVPSREVTLRGCLAVPTPSLGAVVFAHGSGSSRLSTRHQMVAGVLNQAGLATLLFDLLTTTEESDRARVFDVRLLADRLGDATKWLVAQADFRTAKIGYFGASTGAAAALWAAAQPDCPVTAVVSRGGRPDLAAPVLAAVKAPTLLIVGERDKAVLDLNRRAQAALRCEHHLAIVPRAGHLFEEPDALETVAELARDWFTAKMVSAAVDEPPTP
jgi:putative phosphoribosyl transferase